MRTIVSFLLFILASNATAQYKIISYKGTINFEASVPLFEEVKATNTNTTCILNTKTGEINCWVNIKDFKFKRNLMQEHFNISYMESERYPKAILKGIIAKFDLKNINSQPTPYTINGSLTIRGQTKKITSSCTLKKGEKGIELLSYFTVNTDDFKIEIPATIQNKISKNVNAQMNCFF